MINGIVDSVNTADRTAYVKTDGKDEPDKRAYPCPKGVDISVGDTVAIDYVGSSKRIITVY